MQVILSNAEIIEAITAQVLSQISIQEDQQIKVVFDSAEDASLEARIHIFKATNAPVLVTMTNTPRAGESDEQKKVRRTRKAAPETQAEETKVVDAVDEDVQQEDTAEKPAEDDTPPFDTEADKPAETAPINLSIGAIASAATGSANIFPNVESSAPNPVIPDAAVVNAGKSLFANLGKPAH